MRKLVLYHLLSLDGIAFEDGDWFTDSGPEMFANLGRVIGTQTDILLGRGTYDYWVGYWPTSDIEPFAGFINTTPKHVVTSSTPDQEWANTTLVTIPAAEYVTALKQQPGGDIGIHGSVELAGSLLRAR
ncbi:MAG TPA: dihydrofolate reductase family protein, partial [Solirubrobacteraceae bacterium]|nr:dihydrofolate reductase family protein [Solirubrobacteraceae bacterium]